MTEGLITNIIWDNVCFGTSNCTIDTVTYNSISYKEEHEYISCSADNESECDAKVYVSFDGTDKNGDYMQSAGMRMSKYRAYSTASIYSNTLSSFSD